MAEHFRASEGASPAEPMEPDGLTPTPGVPAPEPVSPIPDPVAPQPTPAAPTPMPVSGIPLDSASTPLPAEPEPAPAPVPPSVPGATPSFPRQTPPAQTAVPASQRQQPLSPSASLQMPAQPASAQPAPTAQDLGYEPHGMYASLGQDADRPQINRNLEPTISMRHVTKIYPAQPNKPALEDVSLDIYPGEFVFIVGHSGSGKSTFLRLLTRELQVTSGDIMVAGQSLAKMRNWKVPFLRRQIGCVFQDFKLLQDRTTYENVAFTLECIGKPKSVIKAQVPEVLRLVGLADKMDMFPDQLSGGEQQRVSVARAMVNRPPLLICDEPTGNLDPAISLGIMKLLDAINRNGTTVIMATHDREMVDSMRKRVVALENGHLVRDQERGGYGFYGSL